MSNLIVPLELLPKVDVRLAYNQYYFHSFFVWSILAGLAAKVFYLRSRTPLSLDPMLDRRRHHKCHFLDLGCCQRSASIDRPVLNRLLNVDNNGPVNWITILLVMAAFGAVAEACVLRFGFKSQLRKSDLWLLYSANVFCVAVGAFGMGLYEAAHPPVA